MKTRLIAVIAAVIVGSLPLGQTSTANATEEWLSGVSITRVLSNTNGSWGNCMVLVTQPAPTADCPSRWFHFSCDGAYVAADVGRQSFNVAYAAFLADKTVHLYVDDTKKASGYCFARRIDVTH